MAKCEVCRGDLRGNVFRCPTCAEISISGLLEQLHAEVEYLRQRCEEEGVAVRPRQCFPGRPGVVPAQKHGIRPPWSEFYV